MAEAQAKANDIEAKLHAGGDFGQLARSSSDGTTASEGGDLGTYKRGQLDQVFEEATFPLKTGDYTQPIRTKQGFVILKVIDHTPGGIPAFKDVENDVENNYYMSKMEPAIRDYLTQMRDDASIEIKTGYVDTGASPNKQIFPIAYSAYTPPSPKKKRKVERTRFRETEHGFRQKTKPAQLAASDQAPPPTPAASKKKKGSKYRTGYREAGQEGKDSFWQVADRRRCPRHLRARRKMQAQKQQTASAANEPANPLEAEAPPVRKTRFSDRAKQPKKAKTTVQQQKDAMTPQAPDAAEVADRQTQSAPLGLNGDKDSKKKKKDTATTGEKTRMSERKKPAESAPQQPTPVPPVPGAPAPAQQAPSAPAPQQ